MTAAKHSTQVLARPVALLVALLASCGGSHRLGPPPEALGKARTILVPDGERCPDPLRDTSPVAILSDEGRARPVGRITAVRHHRSEEQACLWAEDGAASAARRLGGDAVVILARETEEMDDDLVACTVEARVLVRGNAEFLADCAREEIEGIDETGEAQPAASAPSTPPMLRQRPLSQQASHSSSR